MDEEEFFRKLSTLRSNTSLGDIVMIRSEKDKEVIKKFNTAQKNIYYGWKNRKNKNLELTEEEIIKRQKMALNFFKGIK